jgi:hypothetical protein
MIYYYYYYSWVRLIFNSTHSTWWKMTRRAGAGCGRGDGYTDQSYCLEYIGFIAHPHVDTLLMAFFCKEESNQITILHKFDICLRSILEKLELAKRKKFVSTE